MDEVCEEIRKSKKKRLKETKEDEENGLVYEKRRKFSGK